MPLTPQLPKGALRAPASELLHLAERLSGYSRVAVVSGAGISTESGLSDYRSPGKRTPARPPINHHQYVTLPSIRKLYWARSFVGYPLLSTTKPGLSHHAFAALHDRLGSQFGLHVTQNVDGLLQAARTPGRRLIELHGSIHRLHCLHCGEVESRVAFQRRLVEHNRDWARLLKSSYDYRPDGDADLAGDLVNEFTVPVCTACGESKLLPSVVFHGGSVPKQIADSATEAVRQADALLVVGSSLSTFSAFRLVKLAKQRNMFVACVNYGPTRADNIVDIKVEALTGDAMARLADHLLVGGFHPPDEMTGLFQSQRQQAGGVLQL